MHGICRLTDEILAYERRVWDALVRGDSAADTALLHAEFIGVYPDGFADRDGHLEQLENGSTITSYSLTDVTIKVLGPDYALICYRAKFQWTSRDTSEQMFVSSVWRRDGASWINIFSQDTPSD